MSSRWVNRGLDALTWLVVAVMLAPIGWLVVSSLQTDGQLSTGAYDLLHPTFTAFSRMWQSVDFERYLINSLIICTTAALLATALASLAGYALARFRFRGRAALSLGVVGTQLIPGSLFLLPVFMGFIWLKQNTPIHLFDSYAGDDPRLHRVLHAGRDLLHALLLRRDPAPERDTTWQDLHHGRWRASQSGSQSFPKHRPGHAIQWRRWIPGW